MRRIIINIRDDEITEEDAITYVSHVIEKGRISNDSKQFPYCVSWPNLGIDVFSGLTRTGNDTFDVVKPDDKK